MGRTGWIRLLLAGLIGTIAAGAIGLARHPSTPATHAALTLTAPVRMFSQRLDEAAVKATSRAQWARISRENTIVVLNSWDSRLIPVLKDANPRVQVWVYKNLSGIRSDDCTTATGQCGSCPQGVADSTFLSSGMGYCWVRHNHPSWLLRAAGTRQPLEFQGYPRIWETDYGNHAYQRQWIRNVLADVRDHGWDGVDVDNALTTADAYGLASKYPTNAAVQAATYSALRIVGRALRHAGVASVFNVGYATTFPGLWERWLRQVAGLEQEFYLSFFTQPSAAGSTWAAYEAEVLSCVTQHKSCWFHTGGHMASVTPRTRGYALASYLLAADSRQLLALGSGTPISRTPCWVLGRPLGPAYRVGAASRRDFAGGIALANPSMSRLSVSLGATYFDANEQAVSTVTLGPTSGAVLGATPRPGCH
ncbi:MAG TPA: putative glycoside hydrolase [Streptosporangiaceae bacterium]|nr:putative glycoside hydrolase [Streptosporangiaceae bacterium]